MAENKVEIELSVEEKAALQAISKMVDAMKKLEKQTVDTSEKQAKANKKTQSQFSKFFSSFKKGVSVTDQAWSSFAGNLAANAITGAITTATTAIVNFGTTSVKAAADFEKGVKEINTILPKNTKLTEKQTDALKDLAKQYGTSATSQASAYYSVISAGVTDAATATDLLARANELAIGGLTSTESAIDILTSAMNAYGQENLSATEAADSLFKAVQLGKTTVDELASSLSKAIPAAKAAGVNIDLLNASVASLTTKGFGTAEAVTRMNALFTALAKNGTKLGAGMDLTALKTDGLVAVLQRLEKRTGGNSDELLKLFGRTEAVQAAQTLMEDGASDLIKTYDEFSNKLGASAGAFAEMEESADIQFKKLQAELEILQIDLGNKLLPILLSAGQAFSAFLQETNNADTTFAQKGIKGVRDELARLEKKAEFIKQGRLLGDPNDLTPEIEKYKKKLLEVSNVEDELVTKRVSNAKAVESAQKALFGESFESIVGTGREEFVTQDQAPEVDTANDPKVKSEKAVSEKVLAERRKRVLELVAVEEQAKQAEQERLLADQEATSEQRVAALEGILQFEKSKAEIAYAQKLEENKKIEDLEARKLANATANAQKGIVIAKAEAEAQKRIDQERVRNRELMVAGFGRALSQASQLAKKGTNEAKLLGIASATINTYAASARAYKDYPYPANIAVMAATIGAGLAQVDQIRKQSFQTGGVVGGFSGSTNGTDNTTANVRTGEMVLNGNQQRQLFDIASGRESTQSQPQMIEVTSIVQVDEREIARAVRNQRLEGFTV